MQEVCWEVPLGPRPAGSEGSRIGQGEELNCDEDGIEILADPMETLEPTLRKRCWVFIAPSYICHWM